MEKVQKYDYYVIIYEKFLCFFAIQNVIIIRYKFILELFIKANGCFTQKRISRNYLIGKHL